MTEKQSRVLREIVKYLIDRENVKASELSQVAGVSRPTVLKLLGGLVDNKIIEKNGSRYGFFGGCVAMFVEINERGGEIFAHSLGKGEISRSTLEFSDMLTLNDNVLRLCKRAEEYLKFLEAKYERVICCFADGRGERLIGLSVPSFFDFSCCKDLLAAAAMQEDFGDKPCFYIDGCRGYMLLCVCGKKIRERQVCNDELTSSVSKLVTVLRPEVAVGEGLFDSECEEAIKEICGENGVREVRVGSPQLFAYEREALIRAICSKIK